MPPQSQLPRRRGVGIDPQKKTIVEAKLKELFDGHKAEFIDFVVEELKQEESEKYSKYRENAIKKQIRRFISGRNIDDRELAKKICIALVLTPEEVLKEPQFRSQDFSAVGNDGSPTNHHLSFSTLISDKTYNFVGREYVFTRFDAFREKRRKGYFSLVGDPGEGKSAIAAELVRRNKGNRYCLYHFNRKNAGPNTAQQFLQNICQRLISLFELSEGIKALENYEDGTYLQEILDVASGRLQESGQKLIIIVDALDEVISQNAKDEHSNVLYLPEIVPPNVYFFVTRRRDSNLRGRLNFDRDQVTFDFLDYDDTTEIGRKILADVREYIGYYLDDQKYPEYADDIREWLTKTDIGEREFITRLTDRSQRNFMYLSYVLPEFTAGGIYQDLEGMTSLPQGLMGYYWDHWQRMGMTRPDRSEVEAVIIYLLTVVYSWVAITTVAEYATITVGRNVSENEVADYFERWQQFLHIEPIENEDTFIIYHESFNDFLKEERTIKATRVRIERIEENYGAALSGGLDISDEDDDDEDD